MNDVLKKAREVYFNLRYIERITDYSRLSQYENKIIIPFYQKVSLELSTNKMVQMDIIWKRLIL